MKMFTLLFFALFCSGVSAADCNFPLTDPLRLYCPWNASVRSDAVKYFSQTRLTRYALTGNCSDDRSSMTILKLTAQAMGNVQAEAFATKVENAALYMLNQAQESNARAVEMTRQCVNASLGNNTYQQRFNSTTRGPGSPACQRCESIRMDGCNKARTATGLATSAGYQNICGHSCASVCE